MSVTQYDDTYATFRDSIRRFASDKVAPFAAIVDQEARPPLEACNASLELGLPGLPFPEEFGGQDGDLLAQVITIEELSRACAATATTISSCWIMMIVAKHGSEAQKRLVILPVVKGTERSAWGLTEPKGGPI